MIQSASLELFTLSRVLTCVSIYALLYLIVSFFRSPRFPKGVEWVGKGQGFFAGLKSTRDWIQAGYDTYSKHGKVFIVPGVLGSPPEVVMPPSQMQWMVDQPDNVLSTSAAHYEILSGDYNFISKSILQDPYHEHVVHRSIARHLNDLIPELDDEVRQAVDDILGTDVDGEWKEVNIMEMLMRFIPRVTNRMLVGKPLCREPAYLDNMVNVTMDIVRNQLVLNLMPRVLAPILGRALSLANYYHFRKTARYSLPLIRQRLRDFEAHAGAGPDAAWKPPNDFVSWTIRLARAEGRADEMRDVRIAERLIPINFASIHTTAITAHSTLMDVLSAANKDVSILESLSEEAERVLAEGGGRWTKATLGRLYRIDSAIRESQRSSSMALTLVHKKVVAPDGVTLPSGLHFEQGTILSCPLRNAQHDEDLNQSRGAASLDDYDAFRFSRPREQYERRGEEAKDSNEYLRLQKMGMVTTSTAHFSFGHGRHAW